MGDVTMTSLVRQLDLHPKTLERRLAAEDNSFERIGKHPRQATLIHCHPGLDAAATPVIGISLKRAICLHQRPFGFENVVALKGQGIDGL